MKYLVSATVIWAFSFSLIGVYLSGKVDPYFSAWFRITLAALLFAPLLFKCRMPVRKAMLLMGIGAVQLGLMYVFYYQSFEILSVPEVLIFTIFTPIYVTLIHDFYRRKFSGNYLLTAILAVAGTAVIRWGSISTDFWIGFLIIQASNFCFAFGQVSYKVLKKESGETAVGDFSYFYLGAWIVATLTFFTLGSTKYPDSATQWWVLIWLGIVASGIGYFLWNLGAREVNAGALAIMNNALVPAGLLVNIAIWNREADVLRLTVGSAILLTSLWLNSRATISRSGNLTTPSAGTKA